MNTASKIVRSSSFQDKSVLIRAFDPGREGRMTARLYTCQSARLNSRRAAARMGCVHPAQLGDTDLVLGMASAL
jgi:hypothetical protein